MRKLLSFGLVLALATLGIPVSVFAQQGGTLNGVAQGANRQALPNYTVQVRNVQTGQLAGTTTSNAAGDFSFASLQPGNYVIEVVDASGKVVGLSSSISIAAGATVTVSVSATAAGAITAASAGGFSLLGLGPIASVAVVSAAGIATVAGVVAAKKDASPSR